MRNLELVLTEDGGAELRDLDARAAKTLVWSSDDDLEFQEEFEPEEFLEEGDLHDIVDYLLDHEVLTEAEADHLEAWEEEGGDDADEDETDEEDVDGDEDDYNDPAEDE
jgi:hypothetical protein